MDATHGRGAIMSALNSLISVASQLHLSMIQSIRVSSYYVPPLNTSSPALAFHITSLLDSYMIWVGITQGGADDVDSAASSGRLTQDWACAMPGSNSSNPSVGTSLFRTSNNEIALPMTQRLARRFKKQIFLSVDLPPSFMTMGEGVRLTLEVEKRAVEILKRLESPADATM